VSDKIGRRSKGSERLERLFAPRVITKTALAESLDVSPQTVWQWIRGYARPTLEHMIILKKRFGINPVDWAKPPTFQPAPVRQRARASAARGA